MHCQHSGCQLYWSQKLEGAKYIADPLILKSLEESVPPCPYDDRNLHLWAFGQEKTIRFLE